MWQRMTQRRITKYLVVAALGAVLGAGGFAVWAVAQATIFNPGNLAPSSDAAFDLGLTRFRWKNARFSGTVTAATFSGAQSSTTGTFSTSLTVGGGTAITKIVKLSQSLSPTAMAALPGGQNATTIEQNFTVNGLTTADAVFINGVAPTAACAHTSARVSSTSTLTIAFTQTTAALCTPATGTYLITAIRS